MHQISGWGFAPDPTGEAHSAPPNLLAGKGERKGMGRDGNRKGREARGGCLLFKSGYTPLVCV